jgi:hypothetical protein
MTTNNFNVAPYFDDYDSSKDFYKVLFTPGRPVQVRELNQLQTILQEQVSRVGRHLFKDGSMVIPGNVYFDNTLRYVKLTDVNQNNTLTDSLLTDSIIGQEIVDEDNCKAIIVSYAASTEADPPTIFIKYTSANDDGDMVIAANSLLEINNVSTFKTISSDNVVIHEGPAASVYIGNGLFFTDGIFATVNTQSLIVSKYSNTPTTRVGLNIVKSIITENDDDTLYDNALGSPNYGAPGAHRFKIELLLEQRVLGTSDYNTANLESFIDLMQIKDGNIIYQNNKTQYAEIMKMIAQRTYDESGDYEITPFNVTAKEYRSNNRTWVANKSFLVGDYVTLQDADDVEHLFVCTKDGISGGTAPVITPLVVFEYNDGSTKWILAGKSHFNTGTNVDEQTLIEDDRNNAKKMVYNVSKGKAYVKGYEVERLSSTDVVTDKALTFDHKNEAMYYEAGSYVELDNVRGIPNVSENLVIDVMLWDSFDNSTWDPSGNTATATYTVNTGVITSITITAFGKGYDPNNPPTITASGGTGAQFVAVVNQSTQIQEIKIISGGTGYSNGSLTIAAPSADPVVIGTCRIRNIAYKFDDPRGAFGTPEASYRTEVFDVNLYRGWTWEAHARSLRYAPSGNHMFSGDVTTTVVELPGLVNVDFSEAPNTIAGIGTNFLEALQHGQTIIVGQDTQFKKTVAYNTYSNVSMEVVEAFGADVTGKKVYAVYNNFVASDALLQRLPRSFVRNIRDEGDVSQTMSYAVQRKLLFTPTGVDTNQLTLTAIGEVFDNPSNQSSFLVAVRYDNLDPWWILKPTEYTLTITNGGKTIQLEDITKNPASAAAADAAGEFVLTLPFTDITDVSMNAVVIKTDSAAREKTKTLTATYVDIRNIDTLLRQEYSLGYPDVFELIRVYKQDGPGTLTGQNYDVFDENGTWIDITNDFILNNGQGATKYDLAFIKRLKTVPNNTIRIVFSYFKHSPGDYFSVDSYIGVDPTRISPLLRDSFDFRPSVDTNGGFDPAYGADLTEPMLFNNSVQFNYSYFEPRRDIVHLTHNNNNFDVVQGTPSFNLPFPVVPNDSMALADVAVMPGYVDPQSHAITKIPHQRYTMEDISKLDRRLKSVEYYIQLSLLEKKAIDERVIDENGLDRFKLGIMVDSFKDYSVSSTSHPDFSSTIDPVAGELRPLFVQDHLNLKEFLQTDIQRLNNNYKIDKNGRVTLNYTTTPFISQIVATHDEPVNPYSVITFEGKLKLFPNSDTWIETGTNSTKSIVDYSAYIGEVGTIVSTTWNQWKWSWTATGLGQWGSQLGSVSSGVLGGGMAQNLTEVWKQHPEVFTGGINPVGLRWTAGTAWDFIYNNFATYQFWNQTLGESGLRGSYNIVLTGQANGTQKYVSKNDTITSTVTESVSSLKVAQYIRTRPILFFANGLAPRTRYDMYVDNKLFFDAHNKMMYVDVLDDGGTIPIHTIDDPWEYSGTHTATGDVRCFENFAKTKRFFIDRCSVARNSTTLAILGLVVKKVSIGNGKVRLYIVHPSNSAVQTISLGVHGIDIINDSLAGTFIATFATGSVYSAGPMTDTLGNTAGLFWFPYSDDLKFPTGFVDIRFCKSGEKYDTATSKANANYYAAGTVQAINTTTVEKKISVISTREVTDQVQVSGRHDPLAQTFTVSKSAYPQGVFVSAAKIWVSAVEAGKNLTVELRPTVNGYPDATKVLATKTLFSDDVTQRSTFNIGFYTRFTFDSLVYLEPGKDYALVVMAPDSVVYKVFVARMGEQKQGTTELLTVQPDITTIGSLFKSQNGSVWEPSQYEDLTFELERADFVVNTAGKVSFVNPDLPDDGLVENPMIAVNGSSTIRVLYPNNGYVVGDKARILFDDPGFFVGGALGTYLSGTYLSGTYDVTKATPSYFEFVMKDDNGEGVEVATTGLTDVQHRFGGSSVQASNQMLFSTIVPNFDIALFENTDYTLSMKTFDPDTQLLSDEFVVVNKENVDFTKPQQITSDFQNNGKTMIVELTMTSTNSHISPVFDKDRASLIAVRNIINDPVLNVAEESVFDYSNTAAVTLNFVPSTTDPTVGYIEGDTSWGTNTTNDKLSELWAKLKVGMSFRVDDVGGDNDTLVCEVTEMEFIGTTLYRFHVSASGAIISSYQDEVDILVLTNHKSDNAPFGSSSLAEYITTPMTLEEAASSLHILADVNIFDVATMTVFYRTLSTNDFRSLNDVPWTAMTASPTMTASQNNVTFVEERFVADNITSFNQVQIKIVMRSSNEAAVPRIKNLRIMALA